MRTYIVLKYAGNVVDWRVIINPEDATAELIGERVREVTYNGMQAGYSIFVYESDKEAAELQLPR
jgi:hypothetical protein